MTEAGLVRALIAKHYLSGDRIWEQQPSGKYASRPITPEDTERREAWVRKKYPDLFEKVRKGLLL